MRDGWKLLFKLLNRGSSPLLNPSPLCARSVAFPNDLSAESRSEQQIELVSFWHMLSATYSILKNVRTCLYSAMMTEDRVTSCSALSSSLLNTSFSCLRRDNSARSQAKRWAQCFAAVGDVKYLPSEPPPLSLSSPLLSPAVEFGCAKVLWRVRPLCPLSEMNISF